MSEFSKEQILEFIEKKELLKLKSSLSDWLLQDIAELITELDDTTAIIVFRSLPKQKLAEVFSHLDYEHQERLLTSFTNKEATFILSEMSPDDRTALFEELPGLITRKLFKLLSFEDLKETRTLLGYPEDSVGRMMTPDYVSIYKNATVKQALERIRKRGQDSETLNIVYVIDSQKRLLDSIKLRNLILAEPKTKIEKLMTCNVVSISAYEDQEEAVRIMQKYDLIALPVVSTDGVIIGIVTIDDVLDIAEEEATEDIQRIGSVEPLKTSYKSTSIFGLYKKRIFWLSMLIVVSLLSSGVLAYYQDVLDTVIALVFFIPLLIGSGGNMGSQSATLIIRALATDDVKLNEWFKVFTKEIGIGLLIGVTLGIFASMVGAIRGGYTIALIVGVSMLTIIFVANLIGASLPFLLSKLKLDPAVASSPLITTIIDTIGLTIYFTVAIFFLGIL